MNHRQEDVLTYSSYQQPWTTRLKTTDIDPELSNSPSSYAYSGGSFNQHLQAASNISPESENSLQNWGASNQTITQPSTTMGDYMSAPYSTTTPWPSMATDQNAYLQKSVDSLINPGLPDFNAMGMFQVEAERTLANGRQVCQVKNLWMVLWVWVLTPTSARLRTMEMVRQNTTPLSTWAI